MFRLRASSAKHRSMLFVCRIRSGDHPQARVHYLPGN
jgi:hypothetical protein